jgi:hypothetical protein
MNIDQLRELIREEIQRVVEDSVGGFNDSPPTDPTNDEVETSLKDKLMQSPGAPFGGNLYQSTGPIISNEAREALHNWMRLTKAAWAKFGHPHNWPKQITDLAVKTGQAFEDKVASKGPTQYR